MQKPADEWHGRGAVQMTAREWKDAHHDPMEDEMVYFDKSGRMIRIQDSEGFRTKSYLRSGRMIRIQDKVPPSADALAKPMALFTELGVERAPEELCATAITVGATLTCHTCEGVSEVQAWRRRIVGL